MKVLARILIGLALVHAAMGQQGEITGAYQFAHVQAGGFGYSGSTSFPAGFSAGINIPVIPWFGVVGDFGWMQKSVGDSLGGTVTGRLLTYGGGPQFTYRGGRNIQPFARCLFGGATATGSDSQISGSGRTTAFFVAPGGGIDFKLHKNLWLRGGADYLHADKSGVSVNAFRAFAGIQFRFGRTSADQVPVLAHASQRATIRPAAQERPTESAPATTMTVSPVESQAITSFRKPVSGMPIGALGVIVSAREGGGTEINGVASGSVAAFAGLRPKDVINSVDGKQVRTPIELQAELSNAKSGDKIRIGYLVQGWWQTETLVILTANP